MTWRTLATWGGLTLLVVGLSGVLRAEAFETGRELGQACTEGSSAQEIAQWFRCVGYIQGFLDAYQLSMAIMIEQAPRAKPPICLPPSGAEVGQVKTLVLDWLKRHPADRGESARIVVWSVLRTVYRCH